jgi:hypothetical protein
MEKDLNCQCDDLIIADLEGFGLTQHLARNDMDKNAAKECAHADGCVVRAKTSTIDLMLQVGAHHTEDAIHEMMPDHGCDFRKVQCFRQNDAKHGDIFRDAHHRQVGAPDHGQPLTERQIHQLLRMIDQRHNCGALTQHAEKEVLFVLKVVVDQARRNAARCFGDVPVGRFLKSFGAEHLQRRIENAPSPIARIAVVFHRHDILIDRSINQHQYTGC